MFLSINRNPEKYKNKTSWEAVKKEIFPSLSAFLVFLGVIMLFNLILVPKISNLATAIKHNSIQANLEKVVDLKNLDIYIDEKNNKAYSFYKIQGGSGTEYLDIDNLTPFETSELPLRYGEFHKIENYEVAFSTHKSQLYTEGLFKVYKNNKAYLIKSYIPQENALFLLKSANFKEALNLIYKDGHSNNLYINQDTNEIAILSNDVIVSSKYAETPYDKEDYFTYRNDVFNNTVKDLTRINKNISVSLLNTYHNISEDIKRVTFYAEGTEDYTYSEIIEIIFDKTSYVFRTGIMDISNLDYIKRAE